MKVLILSCNTGGGHNAAGAAVAEALERRGHTAVLTDFLSLAGEKVSKAVCGTYIGVVKNAPLVFGVTYAVWAVRSVMQTELLVYILPFILPALRW